MDNTQKYRLSMYQDYGQLDAKEHIRLVRNTLTGQVCVKKEIEILPPDVEKFRLNNKSDYFPMLLEIVSENNKSIIIEEYINGVTLADYMMRNRIEETEALRIARQICKALMELHRFTPMIVYRDLKAENIMIDVNGNIKLVDFNISRSVQEGKKRDTKLLGTAEYAAPEQFGYYQTDNRTDIYAFGVLFNYMLTGMFPVEGIAKGKYGEIIRKCTELEPSKRYQNIEEILFELGEEYENMPVEEKKQTWMIPGFRSKTLWKMFVAGFGYLFIFYIGLNIQFEHPEGTNYPAVLLWVNRFIITAMQLFSVLFFGNYRGLSKDFKIYRHRFWIVRMISYVATWFAFFFASIIVAAIIETLAGF